MTDVKKEALKNEFIKIGHIDFLKFEDKNEVFINADMAILTGMPIGAKLNYKRLYSGSGELVFQDGSMIKLKPSVLFIFDDGTFRMYREFNSQVYTKYARPNYNARMYQRFNLAEGSVVLDDDVVEWHLSCGDGNSTFNGNYDKRFYDLIDGGTIEYFGTTYRCR